MARRTSFLEMLILCLFVALCILGQELESQGSGSAPDFFDLDFEFEDVDSAYEPPDEEPGEPEVPDDDEVNVEITQEDFPACTEFDQSAQALYLPEHVLWSVGLEDVTACCEICGAYLECQMWTMDRNGLLCTLLITNEVETTPNSDWATGYKEI